MTEIAADQLVGASDRAELAGAVDVASVVDRDDGHEVPVFVDLVDDAEVAAPSAVLAFEVEPECSPDSVRVLSESAVHELDAGGRDLLRESVERPKRTGGPVDLEGRARHFFEM